MSVISELIALQRESNKRLQEELEKPPEDRNMKPFWEHLYGGRKASTIEWLQDHDGENHGL